MGSSLNQDLNSPNSLYGAKNITSKYLKTINCLQSLSQCFYLAYLLFFKQHDFISLNVSIKTAIHRINSY